MCPWLRVYLAPNFPKNSYLLRRSIVYASFTLGHHRILDFTMIESVWIVVCILLSAVSFLPLLDYQHWFFRIFDFLRIQITAVLLLLLLLAPFVSDFSRGLELFVLFFLVAAILYQLVTVLPYFPDRKLQSMKLENEIVMLAINVQQENEAHDQLVALIERIQPDLFLTVESDATWESHLADIEKHFRTIIRVPQDNTYGMHLYSKLDIAKHEVHRLISEDYPSIEASMEFEGHTFTLWCVHPPPPSPTERTTSKLKDAELLKVARIIGESDIPTLVTGDFNNVTWSKTSKYFSRISKLEDARTNRGLHPTFPANLRLLRFPIDLLFHSKSIRIGRLKTLESIGSDHLPLLFSFVVLHGDAPSGEPDKELDELIDSEVEQAKKEKTSEKT